MQNELFFTMMSQVLSIFISPTQLIEKRGPPPWYFSTHSSTQDIHVRTSLRILSFLLINFIILLYIGVTRNGHREILT